jgi:hypothetical protein
MSCSCISTATVRCGILGTGVYSGTVIEGREKYNTTLVTHASLISSCRVHSCRYRYCVVLHKTLWVGSSYCCHFGWLLVLVTWWVDTCADGMEGKGMEEGGMVVVVMGWCVGVGWWWGGILYGTVPQGKPGVCGVCGLCGGV